MSDNNLLGRLGKTIALAVAFSMLLATSAANAGLITFDTVTNGQVMPGETIGSTAEVNVSYEGDFLGWATPYYPEGDGATGGAIYNTTATGVGTVILSAIPGYTVQLDSVVLRVGSGQPTSEGLLEYSLNSGTSWTEVPTNVAVGSTGLINFVGVVASEVQLRWSDQRPLALGESDTALDNISFTAIPEPASLGLLTLGAVGLLRLRRRSR
jgi:hypothetical protein